MSTFLPCRSSWTRYFCTPLLMASMGATLPREAELQRPNDVHFKPEGYKVLAESVATSFESKLPKK